MRLLVHPALVKSDVVTDKECKTRQHTVTSALINRLMQIIALLVLIIDTCCCLPESLGRSFIFGFIRDSNLDVDNQVLSITVLNGGDQDCHFNLTYRDDYSMSTPPRTTSFVVSKGMTEIPVPSWYCWQYDTPGMQVESGPNQLLTGASSCDVTVIANNYDQSTHQGDSFLGEQ
nr:Protein C12D12.1, isoform c [Haemonchus contortus]